MQNEKSGMHPALKIVAMVAALGAGFWTRESVESRKVVLQPATSMTVDASQPNSQSLASLGNRKVPESQLFLQILELLETNYVNGVKDPMVVAVGSVRGMVNRLMDPDAIFLGKEEFAAMENIRKGKIEGIGAELYFSYNRDEIKKFKKFQQDLQNKKVKMEDADTAFSSEKLIPDLLVRAVAPGSPAEKAGLKPGDRIEKIDTRWVYSALWIDELTKLSNKIRDGKLSSAEVTAIRKQIKEQADNNMVPQRAFDVLSINKAIKDEATNGVKAASKAVPKIILEWRSAGSNVKQKAPLTKGVTEIKPLVMNKNGEYALQFTTGAPSALRDLINKKQPFTINFDNTVYGDMDVMRECLGILVPKGIYGQIKSKKSVTPFEVSGEIANDLISIKAHKYLDGPAKIFCLVFANQFPDRITGLAISNEPVNLTKLIQMPNGSGYSLPYAEFKLTTGATK